MTQTETLRDIQTLIAGRNTVVLSIPALVAPNGPPAADDAGYAVQQVINSFVGIELQARAGRVACTVQVGTVTTGVEFTLDFNSIGAVAYTALVDDTAADVAAGLFAAAGSTFAAVGELALGANGALVMLGADGDAYSVAVGADAGGTITAVREATSVVWRKWYKLPGSSTWYALLDSERTDTMNSSERYVVSGLDRFYIEIVSTDGSVKPAFARCEPE